MAGDSPACRPIRILVVNPNCSEEMTRGIEGAIRQMELPSHITIQTYTAPPDLGPVADGLACPASIDDQADLDASGQVVARHLGRQTLATYDGVLVACFSVHPLVALWGASGGGVRTTDDDDAERQQTRGMPAVTGIFEASILTALSLLPPPPPLTVPITPPRETEAAGEGPSAPQGRPYARWGIVTTGQFWESHLSAGVYSFLGIEPPQSSAEEAGLTATTSAAGNTRFAGVFSTGLNAGDFHHADMTPSTVRDRLAGAARRLFSSSSSFSSFSPSSGKATTMGDASNTHSDSSSSYIAAVVMGCAGMAGLEEIIRAEAVAAYGPASGGGVCIIDGVKAGIGVLEGMVRSERMFLLNP